VPSDQHAECVCKILGRRKRVEASLRSRLRDAKRGLSDSISESLEPCALAGTCSCGKFVVSRGVEAYDMRTRGPNQKSGFRLTMPLIWEIREVVPWTIVTHLG